MKYECNACALIESVFLHFSNYLEASRNNRRTSVFPIKGENHHETHFRKASLEIIIFLVILHKSKYGVPTRKIIITNYLIHCSQSYIYLKKIQCEKDKLEENRKKENNRHPFPRKKADGNSSRLLKNVKKEKNYKRNIHTLYIPCEISLTNQSNMHILKYQVVKRGKETNEANVLERLKKNLISPPPPTMYFHSHPTIPK